MHRESTFHVQLYGSDSAETTEVQFKTYLNIDLTGTFFYCSVSLCVLTKKQDIKLLCFFIIQTEYVKGLTCI